ncbi:MAG: hypothetical protein HOD92_16485 [Deltaproteobacteria bacterium]|jgi:hypothetical protein|nr:hypothetical protein [Deltaproteobacteria bacterium]MBT4525889.1 hypothetical protein [Deltaproteobacteria bacterium]
MNSKQINKNNLIAQWAFDTRPILSRFHIWLKDVDVQWTRGEQEHEPLDDFTFLNGRMERLFAMTGAVTALGTQLFGRFGEGKGEDKAGLNQAKKDADAISAYAMSESLWALSRQLPENHAIMVCLGEGLMAKGGETPEMGSNPNLGFGRIYARPEVANWLEQKVVQLINHKSYTWDNFYKDIKSSGITVWGAAIDTLENTSRFAEGSDTGPLTILHLFDQPLCISKPYEGYIGNLIVPKEVVETAANSSILVNFRTPRKLIVEAIEATYPEIKRKNIHIWTLQGPSRVKRIGALWEEWETAGVHLVKDNLTLPSGLKAFTDSGTYAPAYQVGTWTDDQGELHMFICDGYAASAESMQAASLAPMLNIKAFLSVLTSTFELSYDREQYIMSLDPEAADFKEKLSDLIDKEADEKTLARYREMIYEGLDAGIPSNRISINADDFFPEKIWDLVAISGYMKPDPYTGAAGVEKIGKNLYKVTVRLSATKGEKLVVLTLELMEDLETSQLVFNPLLNRFLAGESYLDRAVKISDSGRIRNELQTLCFEALEFLGDDKIRLYCDRIIPEIIPEDKKELLVEILNWYKTHHATWFFWLELA